MPVAAIAGGVVLDDIAGEHDVLVRHVDDDIPGRMGAAQEAEVDAALAEEDAHLVGEGGRRPRQRRNVGDILVALEQAREAHELGLAVLGAALGDHRAGLVAHDDRRCLIGGRAQHAHGVVVGQHQMADRLVGDFAHLLDHLAGQARGGLRLDDHDAVVADDDAGVRIALGGEGPQALADLGEGDLLLGHVALGGEFLAHGGCPLVLQFGSAKALRAPPGGVSIGRRRRWRRAAPSATAPRRPAA